MCAVPMAPAPIEAAESTAASAEVETCARPVNPAALSLPALPGADAKEGMEGKEGIDGIDGIEGMYDASGIGPNCGAEGRDPYPWIGIKAGCTGGVGGVFNGTLPQPYGAGVPRAWLVAIGLGSAAFRNIGLFSMP